MPEQSIIPKNYDEVYQVYFAGSSSLAQTLVRRALPFTQDASDLREEILQDAFVKLMDMDILNRFDPSKSNFGGMVFCAVRSIVGNYMNKRTRNPLTGLNGGSLVDETGDDEFEPGVYSLDRMFIAATEERSLEASALDAAGKVARLYKKAVEHMDNPRNKRDRNIKPLLDLLAEGYTTVEAAKELGVTNGTVHNWINFAATLV